MELMRYADTSEASSAAQRRNVAVRLSLQSSPDDCKSPDIDPKLLAFWREIISRVNPLRPSMMLHLTITTCQAGPGCLHLHSGLNEGHMSYTQAIAVRACRRPVCQAM